MMLIRHAAQCIVSISEITRTFAFVILSRLGEFAWEREVDTVFLHGLEIEARIGVYDWEQRITQVLRLDIDLANDNARAAEADDIGVTVDYAAVAVRLQALASSRPWTLVETFAESAAALILEVFAAPWVRLVVTKQVRLPERTAVGVCIERRRAQAQGA